MTVCAIHQPNFFPWLPFFDKISKVDVFIFLDKVSYPKSGKSMGSWCNRVNISMNGKKTWFSFPVIREHGIQPINNVLINRKCLDLEKLMYTLRCAYAKKENFSFVESVFKEIIQKQELKSLSDFNIQAIKKIAYILGIKTKFVRQSDLEDLSLSSNEMLVNLCKQVNATTYLSGKGAKAYMDDILFKKNSIEVLYQNTNFLYQDADYSILHYLVNKKKDCKEFFNATK